MSTINRYKLSVIIPGIRPERWTALYDSLKLAIGDNTWEALFVGPKCPDGSLPDVTNVRFIQDRGCPSRAFQIGVSLAEGEYICFGTDDAVAVPGTLDECLKIVTNTNVPVDIVITTYVEGANVYGPQHAVHFQEPSWHAGYHEGLRLPGINPSWFIGLPLIQRKVFEDILGGLDCVYEHINLNIYLLLFKAQTMGYKVVVSPRIVYMVDFDPSRVASSDPILLAGGQDYELLKADLSRGGRPVAPWRHADPVWKRREYNVS